MNIYLTLFLCFLGTTQSSIYANLKDTVRSILTRAIEKDVFEGNKHNVNPNVLRYVRYDRNDADDNKRARVKAEILRKAKTKEHRLNHGRDLEVNKQKQMADPNPGKQYYHMDAVLNHVKRRSNDRSYSSDSSSLEMNDWKDEFNTLWLEKKFEAVNTTYNRGDEVNMAAARPWGVPCGDPNQHDMPWGNCLMTTECDPEYRIYRGDIFCGRTLYVCCALQFANYDLYQGFDVSFADSSFSTDSEEKKARDRGSKEKKKRDKTKQKRKREKERHKRKRKIKKTIKKIVREIRKILNRSYKNASHHRKKKTMILKKYIKMLKKQYRLDRKSVRDIHTYDIQKVDEELLVKLNQIRELNKNFMQNPTFRDIVTKGLITKQGARMLAEAYPELSEALRSKLRRSDGGLPDPENPNRQTNDYLDYDIEYGTLYY